MLSTPTVLLPLAAGVLAQLPPAPPTAPPGSDRGEEFGKTSPIALVVILVLLIATVVLIRSMNRQLRKVPASFDDDGSAPARSETPPDERAEPGTDGSGASGASDHPDGPEDPDRGAGPRRDRTD